MRTRGRKHTYAEKLLMEQVAAEFKKKKKELGAKQAAEELNISLPSFYNYVAGTDLPRMEVLRDAQEKWGIKWERLDLSEILRTAKIRTPEQYAFAFIDAVREEDVKVDKVGAEGKSVLRVMLKIHFPG